MLDKKYYVNGQIAHELVGDQLTYSFKNGKVKAKGTFINGLMEGEWLFYRDTGQLWQIGNFKNSKKNGSFIRYDRNDQVEYQETFENDTIIEHYNSQNGTINSKANFTIGFGLYSRIAFFERNR
jgi:antitoxin component YwqK of YwqJK toxin-antitoxin module